MEYKKIDWSICVGKTVEEACAIIKKDFEHADIVILKEKDEVKKDFVQDRVRIFIDDQDIVTRSPKIG
jgi:hypothetical protein